MSAGYVPQVGDRLRLMGWTDRCWVDVSFSGVDWFVGLDEEGIERPWRHSWGWVKVDRPEPWPTEWIVVCRTAVTKHVRHDLAAAIHCCNSIIGHFPAADLRIWRSNPDGSVTVLDHAGAET